MKTRRNNKNQQTNELCYEVDDVTYINAKVHPAEVKIRNRFRISTSIDRLERSNLYFLGNHPVQCIIMFGT